MAQTFDLYGKTFTRYDTGDSVRVRYVDEKGESWSWQATVLHRHDAIVSPMHPYYTVTGSSRPLPHSFVVDSGDVTNHEPCDVCRV